MTQYGRTSYPNVAPTSGSDRVCAPRPVAPIPEVASGRRRVVGSRSSGAHRLMTYAGETTRLRSTEELH
jgi:hypothetical protein